MGGTGRSLVRCARGTRDPGRGSFREACHLLRDGTNLDVGPSRAAALPGAPGRCRASRPRRNTAHAFRFCALVERLRVEFFGSLNPRGLATVLTMAQNRAIPQ